jgi:hypothetical protein
MLLLLSVNPLTHTHILCPIYTIPHANLFLADRHTTSAPPEPGQSPEFLLISWLL